VHDSTVDRLDRRNTSFATGNLANVVASNDLAPDSDGRLRSRIKERHRIDQWLGFQVKTTHHPRVD
jgi:hypothetical protein